MRKCKRLKSLPELPPSLVYLDADDCTSLEDVSSIKKHFEQALFCEDGSNRWLKLIFTNCFQLNENCTENDTSVEEVSSIKKLLKQAVFCKSLGWLFTNCFQLDQKAVSSAETPKLEMPFEQLVTVLKDYHQARPESKKGTRIVTCVPGSEIPEWFDFKSLGSSINIQLPSEWCSNNSRINFPSFVASVVVSFPDSYNGKELGIRCKCHLKSCNDDSHYLSCYASIGFKSGLSDKLLDHLFLLYGGEEVRGFVKSEASNERFYNEASFSFYLDDGETLHKWIWSECKPLQDGSNFHSKAEVWFVGMLKMPNGDYSFIAKSLNSHSGEEVPNWLFQPFHRMTFFSLPKTPSDCNFSTVVILWYLRFSAKRDFAVFTTVREADIINDNSYKVNTLYWIDTGGCITNNVDTVVTIFLSYRQTNQLKLTMLDAIMKSIQRVQFRLPIVREQKVAVTILSSAATTNAGGYL
ncbi:hypothetical protein GOBAR_AA27029 [Gossypium barbadense]|uniref:C-JID domain-containing protein n=1 Tax=Gossypium barbadense TaxID=3634 RepID=A0A2P5WRF7_GOSBA|nr:hypothetical protein GOBAR_AA27029 [Gossypium barbadense]